MGWGSEKQKSSQLQLTFRKMRRPWTQDQGGSLKGRDGFSEVTWEIVCRGHLKMEKNCCLELTTQGHL